MVISENKVDSLVNQGALGRISTLGTSLLEKKDSYLIDMAEMGYAINKITDWHKVMIPYLLKSRNIDQNDIIVDVGAGQGHCLLPAYWSGYKNLVAIDRSDVNFPIFENEYSIKCYQVDVENKLFPIPDDSVGAVIFFHTIEHLHDPYLCLREIYRILKPNGLALIATPDWRIYYKTFFSDPTHVRPYDKYGLLRHMRMAGWRNPKVMHWGGRYGCVRFKIFKLFPQFVMKWGTYLLGEGRKTLEIDNNPERLKRG